jgi:hypothetical protein
VSSSSRFEGTFTFYPVHPLQCQCEAQVLFALFEKARVHVSLVGRVGMMMSRLDAVFLFT